MARRCGDERGFTFLEFIIVVAIIGALLVLAAERLTKYRVQAEQVSVEQVLGGLRSALGLELARIVVKEGPRGLAALDRTNPMLLLNEAPYNYVGEMDDTAAQRLDTGQWYYNPNTQTLNYLVMAEEYLETSVAGRPRLRFQLRLNFRDVNQNGQYDPAVDETLGFRLEPMEPYTWTLPE